MPQEFYNQHLTSGILLNSSLPYAVISKSADQYHKELSEDFIDTSLLTNKNISVRLVNGNLEHWIVTFQIAGIRSRIHLNLAVNNNQVTMIESMSKDLEFKLFELAGGAWNYCNTVYKFVIVINHVILNLSRRTVIEEKTLLGRTVRELTAFI